MAVAKLSQVENMNLLVRDCRVDSTRLLVSVRNELVAKLSEQPSLRPTSVSTGPRCARNLDCIPTAMDKLWRGEPVAWGTMSGVGEHEKARVRETGNETFPVSGRRSPKTKSSDGNFSLE